MSRRYEGARDAPDGPHKTVTASRTLAFYKPYGVLSCFTDPAGRPTLAGYIPVPDVYPAGRLDSDTEGLLLLTADGALSHHITDPRHKLPKVYLAQVERVPDEKTLARLRRGILLGDRRTRPAEVELLPASPDLPPRPVPIRFRKSVPTAWIKVGALGLRGAAWLKVTLREGQNRQVRRMTAAVGHPTLRLVRIAVGPVTLGDLKPGQWRELDDVEVANLHRSR